MDLSNSRRRAVLAQIYPDIFAKSGPGGPDTDLTFVCIIRGPDVMGDVPVAGFVRAGKHLQLSSIALFRYQSHHHSPPLETL